MLIKSIRGTAPKRPSACQRLKGQAGRRENLFIKRKDDRAVTP